MRHFDRAGWVKDDDRARADSRMSEEKVKDGQLQLELLLRYRSRLRILTVEAQLLSVRHGSPWLWPVAELGSAHWPLLNLVQNPLVQLAA